MSSTNPDRGTSVVLFVLAAVVAVVGGLAALVLVDFGIGGLVRGTDRRDSGSTAPGPAPRAAAGRTATSPPRPAHAGTTGASPAVASTDGAAPTGDVRPAPQRAAEPFDPCAVAAAAEVGEVIEAEVTAAVPGEVAHSRWCEYRTDRDAPYVNAQVGRIVDAVLPDPGRVPDLRAVAGLRVGMLGRDATLAGTRIAGADSALVMSGTLAEVPTTAVLAESRGLYIQVIVTGAGNDNEAYAERITTLLVAG